MNKYISISILCFSFIVPLLLLFISFIPHIILSNFIILLAFLVSIILYSIFYISNRKNKIINNNLFSKISYFTYIYTIGLLIVLFSNSEYRILSENVYSVFSKEHFSTINIIPFKTIIKYFTDFLNNTSSLKIIFINIFVNIVLFIPFGFLITLNKKIKLNQLFIISFTVILLLEIIQFLTYRGSFDIDDIILNVSGIFLGYIFYKLISKKYKGV